MNVHTRVEFQILLTHIYTYSMPVTVTTITKSRACVCEEGKRGAPMA